MPATTITAQSLPGKYSTTGADLTWSSCDTVNGNDIVASSNMLLLFRNDNGSGVTLAITSQPDPVYGRTGNVSLTLAAGAHKMFNLTTSGWADGNGKINFLASSVNLRVAAITLA